MFLFLNLQVSCIKEREQNVANEVLDQLYCVNLICGNLLFNVIMSNQCFSHLMLDFFLPRCLCVYQCPVITVFGLRFPKTHDYICTHFLLPLSHGDYHVQGFTNAVKRPVRVRDLLLS